MRAYKDNISNWGDPNFVPSSSTIGDLARVRALFAREGVPWITPISAHDESMLRHIDYKIDVYLASKAYVADHSDNRELLAIGAIMKKVSKRSGPRGPARLHWALCRNAQAFADHANQRYAAAMEAEAASELEREREEALDELALRGRHFELDKRAGRILEGSASWFALLLGCYAATATTPARQQSS